MDSVNMSYTMTNSDLFLNVNEQVVTNLGVMAAKIAFYNCLSRYPTFVVFLSTKNSFAVDTFLSLFNKSVAIKLGKFRPRFRTYIYVPQFVLFGEESSEITEYLNWLIEMNFNYSGKFILICYSRDYEKCNENNIFEFIEKNRIVHAILLKIGDANETMFFTYRLIVPGICNNNRPEKLDITNGCFNDSCFKSLYRVDFHNFQQCPLIVSTFEQPPFMYLHNGTREPSGGDGEMLKIVTSALNATLIIKTPTDGNDWGHYVDNNWTGSMGDVFNRRANLSVCSLPLTTHKYGNFQISLIYNTMDIVWVAKLPALEPSLEKLLHPFHFQARVSIFITFICVIMLSGFTRTHTWRKVKKSFNIGNPKQSVLFYSWVIFLGIPIVRVPSNRTLRIIVYNWIWFCFIVRNCYQAALINSLKKQRYESNFESFSDISRIKATYGGQGSYREYFVDEKKIYDNWVQLDFNGADETLHKISNGTSSFVLASNKEMVIEHLLKHNGTRRLQMIPQKIINSPTVMYLTKHSPLADPLNIMLSRAVEAGYAQAWHMRYAHKKKILFAPEETHGPKALLLEHLEGCIMLTVLGWAVSTLFFIIEVYCGRIV